MNVALQPIWSLYADAHLAGLEGLLPTCVEFDVAVSAPLVLKQTAAEGALERQLVAVDLLVALQVAQTAEENQWETDGHSQKGSRCKSMTFHLHFQVYQVA